MIQESVGWRSATKEILDAGAAVRQPVVFNESQRSEIVERRVAKVRRYPLWPAIIAFLCYFLPNGFTWAALAIVGWALLVFHAYQNGARLRAQLDAETERLKRDASNDAARCASMLTAASAGDPRAMNDLLRRWLDRRPEAIRGFEPQIEATVSGWLLQGRAVQRDAISATVPRLGRGGRTFYDKRKATDIDEDLTELNAAAALSLLAALFSGSFPQRVSVRVSMLNPTDGNRIAWVTLDAALDYDIMKRSLTGVDRPSQSIRLLGGDTGRSRAQRLTAAGNGTRHDPAAERDSSRSAIVRAASAVVHDPYGSRAAPVAFGGAIAAPRPAANAIPPAPRLQLTPNGREPSLRDVQGQFAEVARRWAAYAGDASARFVPFQAYWPQYSQMTAGQLKYYFKWRTATRAGQTPPADPSYLFVHVYELLHLVGAADGRDACAQIESVWTKYRAEFPKLDAYLISWVADLYATEVEPSAAIDWLQRATAAGAQCVNEDDLLVLADRYWSRRDYTSMPQAVVALLAGDPRLGANKFYREHNADGWIDRAYREALSVADEAVTTQTGVGVRDATILRNGQRLVLREAFRSAVYDWKRKTVALGKVPALGEDSFAVATFRGAVRYVENLLRRERAFASKLRGVEIPPAIAAALDRHFAAYIRTTRPRRRVTIDLTKAKDLARDSADVRDILLAGLDGDNRAEVTLASSPASPIDPVEVVAGNEAPTGASDGMRDGLLTDVAVVNAAIAALSPIARAVLEAVVAEKWEVALSSALLAQATGGALLMPLVEEINQSAQRTIGDVLIVVERDSLVVQEDFRDEVYWVLKGTLEGFDGTTVALPPLLGESATESTGVGIDGYDSRDMHVLAILQFDPSSVESRLNTYAAAVMSTPLLLLDNLNERAIASSFGDIVVDPGTSPPTLLDDARLYVAALLANSMPLAAAPASSNPSQ